MKNYRLKLFLLAITILAINPYAIAQQAAQPPAQQPNQQEKEIRERFEKEINAMVAENQNKSFNNEDDQVNNFRAHMEDFFHDKVPVLFKYSDALKKVNDEFRKEYGLTPIKDYTVFFNKVRNGEILEMLKKQFPKPGSIDFDDPSVAQKLKKLVLNEIERDKKTIAAPLTQAQLESIFTVAQKCVGTIWVHYIMASEKNNKFECQVNSFFLKVLNEVRRENKLPEVKDDSCVIL